MQGTRRGLVASHDVTEMKAEIVLQFDSCERLLRDIQEYDERLRGQEYVVVGPWLTGRGRPHGTRMVVGDGLVLGGEVALVATPEGRLAAGIAEWDGDDRLSVWSDSPGQRRRRLSDAGVIPIGPLEPVTFYPIRPMSGAFRRGLALATVANPATALCASAVG